MAQHFTTLQGLKTGMYYLRTRPAASAIQFTLDTQAIKEKKAKDANKEDTAQAAIACSLKNPEACEMCSGWSVSGCIICWTFCNVLISHKLA